LSGSKKKRILKAILNSNNRIMNSRISFILSLVFLMCFTVSSAQIDLGRIAKKAENKVERKIDKKITKGVDNAIDGTDDAITGKNSKKKKKGKGETKVITETKIVKEVNPNGFRGEFTLNTSTANGQNMLKIALGEYQTAVRPLIVKEPHNLMIYDKKEETLTTVNKMKYEGKAMKDWMIRGNDKEKKETLTLTRTAEVKDIGGYIARKYLVEGKRSDGFMWLTKEIDADFGLICELMGYENLSYPKLLGFPLAIEINNEDGSVDLFSVDSISDDGYQSSLFDVSAYQLIDMTDLEPGN
jgi:hypothetical protein